MVPRSIQASCRLPARRRLALGGLVLSTALVTGAFVSTPAFADPVNPTPISSLSDLTDALSRGDADLVLRANLGGTGSFSAEVGSDTTLDLAGKTLAMDQLAIDDHRDFTLTDSTATAGSVGTGRLVAVPPDSSTGTAIGIGADSTFHVTGASVFAQAKNQGAGIGGTGGPDSTFIADGNAVIITRGDSRSSTGAAGGGAGIGGTATKGGLNVTIDHARVESVGGRGAAGIGGARGGSGGAVTLVGGAAVDAQQGGPIGLTATPASAIGAGQDGTDFGSLTIGPETSLDVANSSPLRLTAGAGVENRGSIRLLRVDGSATSVRGAGTIHNLGAIVGSVDDGDGNMSAIDPATAVDDDVAITGYNYDLALDGNGGSISSTKPTSGHLLSATASDLIGERGYDYTVAPSSDSYGLFAFNTQANGSGSDVDLSNGAKGNLAGVGTSSNGTPVPVNLYAQYARIPYATADSLPDATVGAPYTATLPIAGDGLNSFEIFSSSDPENPVPGLPAGLSLDASTGVISGTPTEAVERDLIVEAGGLLYSDPLSIHISVGGVPVFGTSSLPSGTAGSAYATDVVVSGGPATYAVVAGALPSGLTLNTSTGAITGTPSGSSAATFTIRATNRYGSADHDYGLSIASAAVDATAPDSDPVAAPAPAPEPARPDLASVPRTSVKFGHTVTRAVTADSTLPVTFKVTDGALPKGVSLNAKTGLISGTAAQSGTFKAEVTASSSAGSDSTTVVIVVSPLEHLISTTGNVAAVKAGAGNVPVKVKGFKKGEKWTVRVDGRLVSHGKMKKAGTLSVKVHLAKAKKDKVHTIRIAGSRTVTDPAKTASTTFTVTSLAAKKTLRLLTVSANGVELVAVEKLAAGERVVVKDGKKVIAKGHASRYGIFTFPQAKAGKGTSKLTVQGAAVQRAGTLTVKNPKH